MPIKKSVTPGFHHQPGGRRKFKSLKRHLATHYNLSPDEYRSKWDLPADYPMVASNYTAAGSTFAKAMGLGRKPKQPEQPSRTKRGRKKRTA